MFISDVIYQYFPDLPNQKPATVHIDYFKNMHCFSSTYLDENMLNHQCGYDFLALFDYFVLQDKRILPLLHSAHDVFLIHNAYAHHAEYSHIGSCLSDRYHLSAELFDLMEQGSLCFISTLHILLRFFKQNTTRAIILAFEQRVLPMRYNAMQQLPAFNGIALLSFQAQKTGRLSFRVIESDIILFENIEKKINVIEKNKNVKVYFLTTRTDFALPFLFDQAMVSVVCLLPGLLPLCAFFDGLLHDTLQGRVILFIEDSEMGEWGVVEVEVV